MTQSVTKFSWRLCLSASVLAIVTASPALAQTTVLTSSSANYDLIANAGTDQYVELSSGTDGYLIRGDSYGYSNAGNPVATLPTGGVGLLYTIGGGWQNGIGSAGSSGTDLGWFYVPSNAPVIRVDSGATLTVAGEEITGSNEEFYFYSMFRGNGGEVRFGDGKWTLWGPNSFTNLTLLNNAIMRIGGGYEPWGGCCSGNTAAANTVDGWLAGASTSVLNLNTGSLTVNGVATAAHAFTGVVNIASDATLTIGDSTHPGAVFGDPVNSAAVINLNGSTAVLNGYGTIYGNVNSSGIIKAGGTKGVLGSLTINGDLTLANSSQMFTYVSPTGVSGVTVNGNATLAGEMVINIAEGTYGNNVFPLVAVNGGTITGSFNTVSTEGVVSGAMVGLMQTSSGYSIVTEAGSAAQVFGHVVYANRMALTNFVGSLFNAMAMTPASGAKLDTWIAPIGQIENLSRDGLGYEQTTYGISLGGMHRFERHGGVIGAAFSYRKSNLSVKDDPASAATSGYDLAVYGGADVNEVRFEGTAFYNVSQTDTKRPMGTFGTSVAAQDGYAYGVSGQISHDMFDARLTPYLRATYARMHLAAAAESGSNEYDLAHEAFNINTFVTDIGIRAHLLKPQPGRRFKVDAALAWRYDLSDPGETITASFANFASGSSTSYWMGDSKHAVVGGVDASGQVTDQLEVFGHLGGTFTSHRRAGELTAGVKYRF